MRPVTSAIAGAIWVASTIPKARSMSDQRSSWPIDAEPVSAAPPTRGSARAAAMRSARTASRSSGVYIGVRLLEHEMRGGRLEAEVDGRERRQVVGRVRDHDRPEDPGRGEERAEDRTGEEAL